MIKKWKPRYFVIGAAIVLALIVLNQCFFTVGENETAVLKRFGRIESIYVKTADEELLSGMKNDEKFSYVSVYEGSGLKMKVPFVDSVIKYDARLITYDTPPRQVITSDKKKLLFDNNAQWRISNPLLFNITMGSVPAANTRIDDILYSRMNEKVGKIPAHDLITNTDDQVNTLLTELADESSAALADFGIEIFDIRIRRTDLPQENYDSIYNRMITERNRIAAMYRSEGDEEALKVTSDTDRQVTILLSEARMNAEILKGEGDSEAARIYNEAYSADPDFYAFYNLLETYKVTLDGKTTLVLPLDSPFAKYLTGFGTGE